MMRVTGFSLGSNWGIDEWPDKVRVSHDTRPNVSRVYVPARTCRNLADLRDDAEYEFICSECGYKVRLYEYGPVLNEHCKGCGAKVVDAV